MSTVWQPPCPIARLISIAFAESCSPGELYNFIGPNLEADERVGSECLSNGNVGGIAALRDQHATDSRGIVACIEVCQCPPI